VGASTLAACVRSWMSRAVIVGWSTRNRPLLPRPINHTYSARCRMVPMREVISARSASGSSLIHPLTRPR
jgi:hypothetical protein